MVWLQGKVERTAAIVPVLSFPPTHPTGRHHLSCIEPSPQMAKSESFQNCALTHINKMLMLSLLPPYHYNPTLQEWEQRLGLSWIKTMSSFSSKAFQTALQDMLDFTKGSCE